LELVGIFSWGGLELVGIIFLQMLFPLLVEVLAFVEQIIKLSFSLKNWKIASRLLLLSKFFSWMLKEHFEIFFKQSECRKTMKKCVSQKQQIKPRRFVKAHSLSRHMFYGIYWTRRTVNLSFTKMYIKTART